MAMVIGVPGVNPVLFIAHRGESHDAPENTLAAVHLAWKRSARAVEIDARMSTDGVLVVSHDPDTRRIGGPRARISHQTAAELSRIDAGAWKHRRWTGERIPRLRDVLATVPPLGRLFIEMKEGPETVRPLVVDLARARLSPRQTVVMSFVTETVATAAQSLPEHEVCLLLRARDYARAGAWARAIHSARDLGARGLNVEVHRALDAKKILAAHDAGLTVYTWTVNRIPTARRLALAGIDGITTDRCAWMREQLDA
jgi:glycerophosphoryl diester phosphodiesterase